MARFFHIPLLLFYLWGFAIVLLHAVCASVLAVWMLQFGAAAFGETYDWSAILWHLILFTYFLMLFPGQRVWTVRIRAPDGTLHTIVGDPTISEDT